MLKVNSTTHTDIAVDTTFYIVAVVCSYLAVVWEYWYFVKSGILEKKKSL